MYHLGPYCGVLVPLFHKAIHIVTHYAKRSMKPHQETSIGQEQVTQTQRRLSEMLFFLISWLMHEIHFIPTETSQHLHELPSPPNFPISA